MNKYTDDINTLLVVLQVIYAQRATIVQLEAAILQPVFLELTTNTLEARM